MVEIADKGYKRAILENPAISKGATIVLGKITYPNVAEAFGMEFAPVKEALRKS